MTSLKPYLILILLVLATVVIATAMAEALGIKFVLLWTDILVYVLSLIHI